MRLGPSTEDYAKGVQQTAECIADKIRSWPTEELTLEKLGITQWRDGLRPIVWPRIEAATRAARTIRHLEVLVGIHEQNIPVEGNLWVELHPLTIPNWKSIGHYRLFPQHVETCDQILGFYSKAEFDEGNYKFWIDGNWQMTSATQRFDARVINEYKCLFHNEQPIDNLNYIAGNRSLLGELSPDTELYRRLMAQIQLVWDLALPVALELEAQMADAFPIRNIPTREVNVLSLQYLRGEYQRRDKVIPILEDTKEAYKVAIDIIQAVSGILKASSQ